MSQAVLWETPGLIDVRAFTTFGVNAKPRTPNPIGFFGTGLKYAVAVLCRLGASPRLHIGRDEYQFYTREERFRDQAFTMVRMRRRRWSLTRATHHNLPFTTELGKTWQAWQAFRELESNTRDEGGRTVLVEDPQAVQGCEGATRFVVDHPEVVQAYLDMAQTFLPGGLSVREEDTRVQVMDRPTRHLYYRALRVADLEKPTLYTYNFLAPLELTEDRTLKYNHQARTELARHVVTSQDERFIESVLTAPDRVWEHGLEFDYQNEPPSEAFHAVAQRRRGALGRSALRYYGAWDLSPVSRELRTFEVHPRPWRASDQVAFDASGTIVLVASTDARRPVQLMIDVVDAVNGGPDQAVPEGTARPAQA